MSEPRRWTIYERSEMASTALPTEAYAGEKHPDDTEGIEVMPVSEHEAEVQILRDAWDREVESANGARSEMEGLGTILRGPVHGLLQTIRGMCSDECSYPEIDRKLSRLDDLILGAIGDLEGEGST